MTSVQAVTLLASLADLQDIGHYLLQASGVLSGLLLVLIFAITWKG